MGMINSLPLNCLKDDLLKLIAVNQCQPFEPHEPHDIIVKYDMYLRFLYFSILWIKILDGYQIAGLEELGLWSTSQSSLWIRSLRQKIGVNFPLSILWGYFSFTNTLCNKYCLLILPWFVAICEIWLPGLTHSVYLVLSLKPGATLISNEATMTSWRDMKRWDASIAYAMFVWD